MKPLQETWSPQGSIGHQSHPCLAAFDLCDMDALHHYRTPHETLLVLRHSVHPLVKHIALEIQARRMKIDNDATAEKERIFLHHQNTKRRRIVNNGNKFRACQEISDRIHQCLRTAHIDSISTTMMDH